LFLGVSSFFDKTSPEGKTPIACEASLCLAMLLWFDGQGWRCMLRSKAQHS